jgi:hypothetical protein
VSDDDWAVGDVGILVDQVSVDPRHAKRGTGMMLHKAAPLTNLSREPREHGWCGTTNNISVTAWGGWRVIRLRGWARDGFHRLADLEAVEGDG